MPLLCRSEWPLIVYFLYTAALWLVLHLRPPIPAITVALNLAVIAGFLVLARAHSLRNRYFLGVFRDWYPVPLMLLAYREMGWFADPRHTVSLERSWEAWDKLLLNHWWTTRSVGVSSSSAYGPDREGANRALAVKAAMFRDLGVEVNVCGTDHGL